LKEVLLDSSTLDRSTLDSSSVDSKLNSPTLNKKKFSSRNILNYSSHSTTSVLTKHTFEDVFCCPEESLFYSQCLEKMVLNHCLPAQSVVEFGAGDGSPVINALLKTKFDGVIHGYELNPTAYDVARSRVNHYNLNTKYKLHNQCFFSSAPGQADYLIANPPYIPAPDDDICMPSLYGGVDGATITKRLLSIGCNHALLMISAYSNPIETIEHAIAQGYVVTDFMISPLPFGYYSSEPKVKRWIAHLRQQQKAFYSHNIYFLAGVLFQMRSPSTTDLSAELIKVMTAL
jgi:hypothetical protein